MSSIFLKLKNNIFLVLILAFSLFLYTYRLGTIPPSLYADEATESFSALSLWQTGQDEYGKSFPLLFRLFGAYTPPLYIYLSAPIIGLFGQSVFNIRLLSALSGLLSVYVFYLIVSLYLRSKNIQLISTFLYAILPWTVFNSRLGYEVMLAATLFNLGVYFLLTKKHDFWAFTFMSLSVYTAHTQKFLVPLFLFFYLIYYRKFNFKNLVFLFLTQLPNFYLMTTSAFWAKSSGLSHFSLQTIVTNFYHQFVNYLSPYTLFFEPQDIDQQHLLPQIGLFFWWLIFPLFFGLKKAPRFLIYWLLISLVPACLSGSFISVQRALPLLFPLMLIISFGLDKIRILPLCLLSLYSFLLLYRSYFVLFPNEKALAWNYGYQPLSEFVKQNSSKKFLIDNSRNNGSYALMLFYLNYSPAVYHRELGTYYRDNYYSVPVTPNNYSFANLVFKPLDWQDVNCQFDYIIGDGLSISPSQSLEHHLELVSTIKTPLNETALKIFAVSKDGKLCHE